MKGTDWVASRPQEIGIGWHADHGRFGLGGVKEAANEAMTLVVAPWQFIFIYVLWYAYTCVGYVCPCVPAPIAVQRRISGVPFSWSPSSSI